MTGAVVLCWSAVSPFGIGRRAFEDGMSTGARTPVGDTRCIPSFDTRELLGAKGTRALDRVTVLALVAARELLADATSDDADGTGVVIATSGTVQGMYDFTRRSVLAPKPFHVDPAVIPSGLMNHAAGRTAIRHRLRGPNVTVAGGRVGAAQALATALRLLGAGRARRIVVGAVEECSPTRAVLEGGDEPAPLGEGCVLFLLGAPPEGPGCADVLGVRNRVFDPADPATGIRRCLLEAVDACALAPSDVLAVSLSRPSGALGRYERDAARLVFGPAALANAPDVVAPFGATASALGAFQFAALLGAAPGVCAVVSVDHGGGVACVILRTGP